MLTHVPDVCKTRSVVGNNPYWHFGLVVKLLIVDKPINTCRWHCYLVIGFSGVISCLLAHMAERKVQQCCCCLQSRSEKLKQTFWGKCQYLGPDWVKGHYLPYHKFCMVIPCVERFHCKCLMCLSQKKPSHVHEAIFKRTKICTREIASHAWFSTHKYMACELLCTSTFDVQIMYRMCVRALLIPLQCYSLCAL